MIKEAEVHWNLTDICNKGCVYCPSKWSGNTNNKNLEDYQVAVRKLQDSRYKNAESIKWKLGGGEPLQFFGLEVILNEIKKKPSYVRVDTSGGDTWFDLMTVIKNIDQIKLTQHSWQNPSVANFIIDLCKDNNVKLDIVIPLMPGHIQEGKDRVQELIAAGISAHELILKDPSNNNNWWSEYSQKDMNILNGLPEDWTPPPPEPKDPNAPDPAWVDPRIIQNPEFVYTGKQCYAGVDYIFISGKGWVSSSLCGARELGNIFDKDWVAPETSFACPMFQCSQEADRTKIRMNQ